MQSAATVAVTLPEASIAMPVTVMPAGGVAVTVSVLAAWSRSLTVAICDEVPALPCWRMTVPPAVIVGGLF